VVTRNVWILEDEVVVFVTTDGENTLFEQQLTPLIQILED
jgi:hypothetical protein